MPHMLGRTSAICVRWVSLIREFSKPRSWIRTSKDKIYDLLVNYHRIVCFEC